MEAAASPSSTPVYGSEWAVVERTFQTNPQIHLKAAYFKGTLVHLTFRLAASFYAINCGFNIFLQGIFCNKQILYIIDPCQGMKDNGDEEGNVKEANYQREDTAEVRLTILIKI